MRKVTTYGTKTGDKLRIHYRSQFDKSIGMFPDGRVQVTVERLYRKRSVNQNAYYWGVIVPVFIACLFDDTGERITQEEAHEQLKQVCNPTERVNKRTGEVVTVGGSTKQLTTVEFEEYADRCRRWIEQWFNLDKPIPLPGEQGELW